MSCIVVPPAIVEPRVHLIQRNILVYQIEVGVNRKKQGI
jgi:hypothetical protein